MPNTSFAFKQFTIKQDQCAMKVGTDAVLLGAWVVPNGAKQNVLESNFSNQISVVHSSFQEYTKGILNKYDLIVTNPPYFEQSLKSSDEQRSHARHADVLPFEELLDGVVKLLDERGKFCLILPTTEAVKFRALAEKKGLNLSKLLRVKSRVDKNIEKRHIMQFEFKPTEFSEETIAIELEDRHAYTEEYKELTQEYYLNF